MAAMRLVLAAALLAACGSEPSVSRVDALEVWSTIWCKRAASCSQDVVLCVEDQMDVGCYVGDCSGSAPRDWNASACVAAVSEVSCDELGWVDCGLIATDLPDHAPVDGYGRRRGH